ETSRGAGNGPRVGGRRHRARYNVSTASRAQGETVMADAVIVSTARTPIGRAYRGAFNNTHGAAMAGHVIANAEKRARVEPREDDDDAMGVALPEGAPAQNVARHDAL